MNFETYPDAELMAIDLANHLAGELGAALLHEERVLFAVPGGTSPGPVFDALCAADIEWDRVDVMLTDERWVPEDHPRSNSRLIKERLLVNRAATARFVPMCVPGKAPEDVFAELESMILPKLPIGVLLLGMGPDMHTASLFPGAEGLDAAIASNAPVLVKISRDDLQETRVTLSARVLNGALSKHLLITGAEKRAAIERAFHLPPEEAPVASVLGGMTVHWAQS